MNNVKDHVAALLEDLEVLQRFIDTALENDVLAAAPVGQKRLDLLQARHAVTASGMRYDEFYGHRDAPLPLQALTAHMFSCDEDES